MSDYRNNVCGPLPPSELRRMMRRHRVTIRDLARRLGSTQRRVREIRNGAAALGVNAARDWIQAITGTDPGQLY